MKEIWRRTNWAGKSMLYNLLFQLALFAATLFNDTIFIIALLESNVSIVLTVWLLYKFDYRDSE